VSKIITLPGQHFVGRLPKRPNPEIGSSIDYRELRRTAGGMRDRHPWPDQTG